VCKKANAIIPKDALLVDLDQLG